MRFTINGTSSGRFRTWTSNRGPTSTFDDVEVFYNRQRRHLSLDFVSPFEFELSIKEEKSA